MKEKEIVNEANTRAGQYFPERDCADRYVLGKKIGYARGFRHGAKWVLDRLAQLNLDELVAEIAEYIKDEQIYVRKDGQDTHDIRVQS